MAATETRGQSTFATGSRLFVNILALANAVAFGCAWWQWKGLIGPSGILPAGQFFSAVYEQVGARGWFEVPSLCWAFGGNHFIVVLCIVGLAASLLLYMRVAPALCLAVLWVSYLSIMSAGQIFFDLQWDGLLLECNVLAILLVPWTFARASGSYDPPKIARSLVWWLLFRLMFVSGAVKIASGDPVWRNLTALAFHYQTQPLPSPLAWYANCLPLWVQRVSCALMFVAEIAVPFLLPLGRAVRHRAALVLIVLQVAIALTGNYGFFNLLTIGICLTCLDDEVWLKLHWGAPEGASTDGPKASRVKPTLVRWSAAFVVGITFFQTVAALYPTAASSPIVTAVEEAVGPFRTLNNYRLFAVMTLQRPELVLQGSDDGKDWRDYELPYKPGALSRRPAWVAPYQPQLDWMLWFAALGRSEDNLWVSTVCEKLLQGDAAVVGLFEKNPFPEHPPKYMRVVRYRYEFTSPEERSRTGNWWRSTPIDFYISPVALTTDSK